MISYKPDQALNKARVVWIGEKHLKLDHIKLGNIFFCVTRFEPVTARQVSANATSVLSEMPSFCMKQF